MVGKICLDYTEKGRDFFTPVFTGVIERLGWIPNLHDYLFFLDRFEALSLRFALQQVPDFRWCKNGNCPAGQIHEGGRM